jgi:nucleoside-diphosphate-sugar epimerase
MKSVFLTGSNGFIGTNMIKHFNDIFSFSFFNKNQNDINISQEIVINLAGKAHDTLNVSSEDEYYLINTNFAKKIFDAFINSNAQVFITLSSVKAVADTIDFELTENCIPNPATPYGKSKLLAEQYILSKHIPEGKRVYVLRPCMIHGPGNKGNLNLLYTIVKKGIPWPLGAFENRRSFCSIDNLCFIINELINNEAIPSGVYNVADDEPIATNELIKLMSESQEKNCYIWYIPKSIIKLISKLGHFLKLPLNSERLNKLTETYIVSNNKILTAINKPLPLSAKEGLMKTLNSFYTNDK